MTLDTAPTQADLDTPALSLTDEAADLLFRNGRTANRFAEEPVTETQMRAVHDLVKWGPTAMNTQPLRVVLVATAEGRDRLVPLMSEGNQEKTKAAPLVALLAADTDFHEEMHRTTPHAPTAAEMFAANDGARQHVATLNAHLQAGYFLLGVRAAGLAAGPMGGFDADAVSQEFFPDGKHKVFLVVNLGRPTEDSYRPRAPRLDFEDVVTSV